MEHIISSDDQFAEMQVFHGQYLALSRATVPKTHSYNDGGRVRLGDYSFDVARTYSVEEFEKEFNKNSVVKASWNGSWVVKPVDNIYGISGLPVNTYENAWGVRKRVELRGSNYFLLDVKTLDVKYDFCYWMPGEFFDTNHYKNLTSQTTLSRQPFGNSISIGGTGLEFSGVNWAAGSATDIVPNQVLSSLASEDQYETLILQRGDFYVSQQTFPGRFIFDLHGQGEGFIMQSWVMSVVRKHTDQLMFSFRVRAGQLIDLKHCTKTADLPTKTQKLYVQSTSGTIEVWADDNTALVKVLQGDFALPSDCRLCLQGMDQTSFPIPQYQTLTALATTTRGTMCMAIKSATDANYMVFESNLFKLAIANNILVVNEVSTALTIAHGTRMVISCSFRDTKIEVSVLNIDSSSLQQYASTAAEASFVAQSGYTVNYKCPGDTGFELSGLIMVYENDDGLEKKLVQEIQQCWSGSEEDLGTYSNGSFTSGASLAGDVLDLVFRTFTRVVPKIDRELQNIFRLDEEIFQTTIATKHGYTNRISSVVVRATGLGVDGLAGNVIYTGVPVDGHIENVPRYFSFDSPGMLTVFSSFVDAQDGHEKTFVNGESSYTILLK